MSTVYEGGRQAHLDSETLYRYVKALDSQNGRGATVQEISDSAAQTIAAMFHSPNNESTYLSTRGMVTSDMRIQDFCTNGEYGHLSPESALLIDYLESYILSKQD